MTGAIWFIGDTHFGHEKVSALRGFDSTDAHDAAIVRKWAKQVNDNDLVYVLGDISGGSRTGERHALTILKSLPGRKRLISGNHDSVSSIHRQLSPHIRIFNSVFERVSDFGIVKVEGQRLLMSHFPYTGDHKENPRHMQFRLPDLGNHLIHAHTHSEVKTQGREMCVSWEAWNRMVNLGDVANWVKETSR